LLLWLKIGRFFLFVESISGFRTLYLAEIFGSVFGSVLGSWVLGFWSCGFGSQVELAAAAAAAAAIWEQGSYLGVSRKRRIHTIQNLKKIS
jgi:hypothetical protein